MEKQITYKLNRATAWALTVHPMALLGPFLGQDQGKTGAKYAEFTSSHQDSEGIELWGILAAMSEGGGVGLGIGSSDQGSDPKDSEQFWNSCLGAGLVTPVPGVPSMKLFNERPVGKWGPVPGTTAGVAEEGP